MLNSPMLSIFQHFHAIPLRSPLISLRSKWRLTGFSRRFAPKNPVRLHILPSALPPKGEARRYVANDFLNLIAFPSRGRCPEGADRALAAGKRVGKAEKCVVYESNRAPHILAAKPPPSFLIRAKLLSPMKGRHAPRAAPEPMTPSFPIPWPAPLHSLRCVSRHGGRGSFYF